MLKTQIVMGFAISYKRYIESTQVLFTIQVTAAHKRHGTPPHCMFAIDNIVRIATNVAVSIISPGIVTNNVNNFLIVIIL